MGLFRKLGPGDKGTTLVLVALMLVVLIGFMALVVDMGALSANKRKLVAAADAAALAGAQTYANGILSGTDPHDTTLVNSVYDFARNYAINNGADPNKIEIAVDEYNYKITVDLSGEYDLHFAPVLGVDKGTRAAHAEAITGPVGSSPGATPVFIEDPGPGNVPKPGDTFVLKDAAPSPQFGSGSFGCLTFSGNQDKDEYETRLKFGYDGTVCAGTYIATLNGNNTNQTTDAIKTDPQDGHNARFERCTGGSNCKWDNHESGCPRVVIVPVCDISCYQPNDKKVYVVGFATFFIDSYTPPSGHGHASGQCSIYASFMNSLAVGQVGGPGTPDFGTWAVNLIE
ncbi:MAG: pilus assembly protein TadG-related protein [Bacillota bacterium]